MHGDFSIRLAARAVALIAAVLLAGNINSLHSQVLLAGPANSFNPYLPVFTNSEVKIAETALRRFTSQLVFDAVNYEPLLVTPRTQVHMGFWSGPGNHGSLVRVLDSINSGVAPCVRGASPNCAVWDEGATTSEQYPSFVQMLVEHWYDRGNTPAGSRTVTIYGKTYPNRNPLDFHTADRIWGQYSQRYADMAREFYHATGKPVIAWCFVQGARPTRIFYAYEYPELRKLELEGVVKVFCAKTQDADWTKPDDWTAGTGSAACPGPKSPSVLGVTPEKYINVFNR
jgi:hypothetical protein